MPRKTANILGTGYHDDYEDFEDAGAEYSSEEEEDIGSEDSLSDSEEEYVGSDEYSSSDEAEVTPKVSKRMPASAKTSEIPEVKEDDFEGGKWQKISMVFRKSFTISGMESTKDGSAISFKMNEEHQTKPWEKLGEFFQIDDNSILGPVTLTQASISMPCSFAYIASMKDPKDGSERVSAHHVLPDVSKAVSGIIAKGQSITSTDEPITLIEAPDVIKPTFLSTIKGSKWTHEKMRDEMYPEPDNDTVVRVHKSHPVLLSHLLGKKRQCEKEGKTYVPSKYLEKSGQNCFLIPKEAAFNKLHQIILDSKKNTTADFFYNNFRVDFVRAWTDGHAEDACASNIGDETELFDNVSDSAKESMKEAIHSISFTIEAQFYTGKL